MLAETRKPCVEWEWLLGEGGVPREGALGECFHTVNAILAGDVIKCACSFFSQDPENDPFLKNVHI